MRWLGMRQALEDFRGESMNQRYTKQYCAHNFDGEWSHPFFLAIDLAG
jgi:hypothetical protein